MKIKLFRAEPITQCIWVKCDYKHKSMSQLKEGLFTDTFVSTWIKALITMYDFASTK